MAITRNPFESPLGGLSGLGHDFMRDQQMAEEIRRQKDHYMRQMGGIQNQLAQKYEQAPAAAKEPHHNPVLLLTGDDE